MNRHSAAGYHTLRASGQTGRGCDVPMAGTATFLAVSARARTFESTMLFSAYRETWVPVALYAELVADEEVLPAFVTNISEHGLQLDSLAMLGSRRNDRIQLQITLPGEPDRLWIAAEVVQDQHGLLFNDTAIRFLSMASAHWRALRRWVRVRELMMTARPLGASDAA